MPPQKFEDVGREGKTAGQETSRANGTKRKYKDGEDDTGKRQQDHDDGDDDIEIVAERRSRNSGMDDPLQRQKQRVRIAMTTNSNSRVQQRHSRRAMPPSEKRRGAGLPQKESKWKDAHARNQPGLSPQDHNYIDLTESDTVESSRTQLKEAVAPTSGTDKEKKPIQQHVDEAFQRLDSAAAAAAAQRTRNSPQGTQTQGADGDFGPEIVRAIRDGSFHTAVEEVSRRLWAWDDEPAPAPSAAVLGSSKAGKADTLVDSVRTLRREKAAFVDRIADLSEEKAAAMEREAALLRRVAELERLAMVQVNPAGCGDRKKEEGGGKGEGVGVISPSPTPQAP